MRYSRARTVSVKRTHGQQPVTNKAPVINLRNARLTHWYFTKKLNSYYLQHHESIGVTFPDISQSYSDITVDDEEIVHMMERINVLANPLIQQTILPGSLKTNTAILCDPITEIIEQQHLLAIINSIVFSKKKLSLFMEASPNLPHQFNQITVTSLASV